MTHSALLILQINLTPRLFFVPSQATPSNQYIEEARAVVGMLISQIGQAWKESWLDDGVPVVLRQNLRTALDQTTQQTLPPDPRQSKSIPHELQQLLQVLRTDSDRQSPEQREMLCRQAIGLTSKADLPGIWAELHNTLGNTIKSKSTGDQATNLDDALTAYDEALSIWTKQSNPKNWALLKANIARTWGQRINGLEAENIEKALSAFHASLEVIDRASMPREWAMIQGDLGLTYRKRIVGSKAENIEEALKAYNNSLLVISRQSIPMEWARINNNMSLAYVQRVNGIRQDNIENAIKHATNALEILTSNNMPTIWSAAQNNLGIALTEYKRGDIEANIEKAISAFRQALTVRTKENMPAEWAITLRELARAYSYRIAGNPSENFEQAIELYNEALPILKRYVSEEEWATATENLAETYSRRIDGDRVENLEKCIELYKSALEVLDRSSTPYDWARATMNLATAYVQRIRGEKADNIEQALYYIKQSLEVRTRDRSPIDWALNHANLGSIYLERIKGNRSDNIENAIQSCEFALEELTIDVDPVMWARCHMSYGMAYQRRIAGDRESNHNKALQIYETALKDLDKEQFPQEWARIVANTGGFLVQSPKFEAQNIERAISCFQDALEIITFEENPFDWAISQWALGLAYSDRVNGNRDQNITHAIEHFDNALSVYTLEKYPVQYQHVMSDLGDLHFTENKWNDAQRTYTKIISANNIIFQLSHTDMGRTDTISEMRDVYSNLAYSLIQLSQFDQALRFLEMGKARFLAEKLAFHDAQLVDLENSEREEIQRLHNYVTVLETQYRSTSVGQDISIERDLSKQLEQARKALQDFIDHIRKKYPNFMPAGLDLKAILDLIPEHCALVAPVFTSQGSAVFVVPHDAKTVTNEHVIHLDDYKTDDLNDSLIDWLSVYVSYRSGKQTIDEFYDRIEIVMAELWDAFVGKIHARLYELHTNRIIFIPQGALSLLPIHATWNEVDRNRKYLMDYYQVTYTPSMYSLHSARRRSSEQAGRQALIAGVSQYKSMSNLPNAKAEAESIAGIFNTTALLDETATVAAIIKQSVGKNYLHLSCHGSFGWGGDALTSALYLANDESLSLSDIMGKLNLATTRLVTLSACETGIVDFQNIPDEFLGLPTGFLQARASAVVSSLWTVDDRSTALLMVRMYNNMFDKDNPMEPTQALRNAQIWLREATVQEIGEYYESHLVPRMSQAEAADAYLQTMRRYKPSEKPYSHPFYWAAFTYTGA